jgi:hypothetical protein
LEKDKISDMGYRRAKVYSFYLRFYYRGAVGSLLVLDFIRRDTFNH